MKAAPQRRPARAARQLSVLALALLATVAGAEEDFLDPVEDALAVSAAHDCLRAKLSGTLDLEGYQFAEPAPALMVSNGTSLFLPRLSLYLDAQLGPTLYAFAASRIDRGFDPSNNDLRARLDEYALRFTPWQDGRFNLQLGKFATVVGNWTLRHDSWENPFISAPLPYENLTGVWDIEAARSAGTVALWANVGPRPSTFFPIKSRSLPILWGPSYTSGGSVAGILGQFEYAAEVKNASLSSPPGAWDLSQTQWQNPTTSARLGYRPSPSWNLGMSASAGSYLRASAAGGVPPGYTLGDYREILFGQDVAFAWHHWQVWAEAYETRFEIPRVGNADTVAYYLEAKFKLTPQFFASVRWNQQLFATLSDGFGGSDRWGANIWRIDTGPAFRFTAHTQLKLQYSFQRQNTVIGPVNHLVALQLTTRF
jgi:hypothetical protein